MKELDTFSPEDFGEKGRSKLMLVVCDEGSIRCNTFQELQDAINAAGVGAVLVMPDHQYQKGKRGWAKVQILSSVSSQLIGVMPLGYESARRELKEKWAVIEIRGPVSWINQETITQPKTEIVPSLPITETTDPFDREMIARAKGVINSSNCWLDPAGCVFVRDGEMLLESWSTSLNHSGCIAIPIDFRELPLDPGERMMFCDSLHAERVGISRAAEAGISLRGSTMYVNKFPCRPCALDTITAGIISIVFDQGSYGLAEAADLFKSNQIILKRVVG